MFLHITTDGNRRNYQRNNMRYWIYTLKKLKINIALQNLNKKAYELHEQVSATTDRPAQRVASRPLCSIQMRCRRSV